MLAPAALPQAFASWNRQHGAPAGRRRRALLADLIRRDPAGLARRFPRLGGPFSLQSNNSTRAFEYPWAFHAVPVRPGDTVVDVGGSLCGFQFVLARAGAHVFNVDPGEDASGVGWPVGSAAIARLNRAFRTDVRLIPTTLADSGIANESVDTVYSISTIEHIPDEELAETMRHIGRILRPGGHAVLTVDLFPELVPFTSRQTNRWGGNANVKRLVDASGLTLAAGDPAELNGFEEFDPERVLSRLSDYLVGSYPALAQCFVLSKTS